MNSRHLRGQVFVTKLSLAEGRSPMMNQSKRSKLVHPTQSWSHPNFEEQVVIEPSRASTALTKPRGAGQQDSSLRSKWEPVVPACTPSSSARSALDEESMRGQHFATCRSTIEPPEQKLTLLQAQLVDQLEAPSPAGLRNETFLSKRSQPDHEPEQAEQVSPKFEEHGVIEPSRASTALTESQGGGQQDSSLRFKNKPVVPTCIAEPTSKSSRSASCPSKGAIMGGMASTLSSPSFLQVSNSWKNCNEVPCHPVASMQNRETGSQKRGLSNRPAPIRCPSGAFPSESNKRSVGSGKHAENDVLDEGPASRCTVSPSPNSQAQGRLHRHRSVIVGQADGSSCPNCRSVYLRDEAFCSKCGHRRGLRTHADWEPPVSGTASGRNSRPNSGVLKPSSGGKTPLHNAVQNALGVKPPVPARAVSTAELQNRLDRLRSSRSHLPSRPCTPTTRAVTPS